jgi:uncharacterized protein YbdZ (MbtH family)
MARNRRPSADARRGGRTGSRPGPQLAGLRWVPVPLAMLLAVLGFLVLGAASGQHAVNHARELAAAGLEAGGLGLTVNTELWVNDSMAAPGKTTSKGFSMPSSEMPGLATIGDQRLRIEVYIRNVSKDPQRYALTDFVLVGPGGASWKLLANAATQHSIAPQSGDIGPGWSTTADLYYDVPNAETKHLSVRWTHNGTTVTFPVHPSGLDSTSVVDGMPGM